MSEQPQQETEQVRAEIGRTREQLADTVDALSGNLNVKKQAHDRAAEAKAGVLGYAHTAEPLAVKAAQPVAEKAKPIAVKVKSVVLMLMPYRRRMAAASVAAGILVIVLGRRRA